MYRAVFFDLDGTLLPIDTRAFMARYFEALAAFFAGRGLDPEAVMDGVREGTRAMFAYDGETANETRFWRAFPSFMEAFGTARDDWRELFAAFYAEAFPLLGEGIEADPDAGRAVACLRDKGYRLVLATNPLFPPEATACRLSWTGADPSAFERVTAYHNSRFAKPSVDYYVENLAALGLAGPEVLMVGNDPVEDAAARMCGCGLYLVTDHLVDREGEGADLAATPHGTLADFVRFAEALPPCGEGA